ncbi:MAG: hypothetical protein ABEI99_10135, partial [Halobaculum sp.]
MSDAPHSRRRLLELLGVSVASGLSTAGCLGGGGGGGGDDDAGAGSGRPGTRSETVSGTATDERTATAEDTATAGGTATPPL